MISAATAKKIASHSYESSESVSMKLNNEIYPQMTETVDLLCRGFNKYQLSYRKMGTIHSHLNIR